MAREWQAEPGTAFVYDTGVTQIVSVVLEEATGMSVLEYAEAKLFTPLRITDVRWDNNGDGVNGSGEGLFLRPREMMNFGQFVLNEGAWEGEQLVSAEYVREATVNQLDPEVSDGGYGYLWWLNEFGGHPAHTAVGYGGQWIIVVPNLDLVVTITSNALRDYRGTNTVVREIVMPAIVE